MKKNNLVIISLACIIGLISGITTIIFTEILDFGYEKLEYYFTFNLYKVIIPFIAATALYIIRKYILKNTNLGFGVAQVLYELDHIKTQEMKIYSVFYKIIGTLITLLSGFSVGRQGPIIHLGGAIGSSFSYFMDISEEDRKILIASGVAGCLSGAFRAPIFATIFAVEVLLKKCYFEKIAPILFASITSVILVKIIYPSSFINNLNITYSLRFFDILIFIIMGLFLSLISALYIKSLEGFSSLYKKLNYDVLKHISSAVIISFSLIVFSKYYQYNFKIDVGIFDSFTTVEIFFMGLLLILLTGISLGSGMYGGIFNPGLNIGFIFGLFIAKILLLMGIDIETQIIVFISMACIFSGFANAPLSATIMIAELTNEYSLIIPTLIASLITSLMVEMMLKDSIYHIRFNNLLKANQ